MESIRRRYVLWGGVALIAIALGAGAAAMAQRRSSETTATRVLSEQAVPTAQDPISLATAFTVVQRQLASMPGSWAITSLASVDSDGTPSESSGHDGTRDAWVADVRGEKGEIREVQIVAGKVVRVIAPTTLDSPPSSSVRSLPPPTIDSPDVVARARAAVPSFAGALPSAETMAKYSGIQFVYGFDGSTDTPTVTALGASNNVPARVLFRLDGTILSTQLLSVDGGAIWWSNDSGITWRQAEGVAGTPVKLITGESHGTAVAFVVALDIDHLSVWTSADDSWSKEAELPSSVGNWARGLAFSARDDTLQIATTTGLWTYSLVDGSIARASLKGNITDVAVGSDGIVHAISVDSSFVPHHYIENASDSWNERSAPVDHLAVVDGRVVEFNQDSEVSGVLGATSSLAGAGPEMVRASANGLMRSVDGGTHWSAVAISGSPDFVKLATAPSFARTGMAVAGVFRGAIWRSTDFGATWHAEQGPDGEPAGLAYLSDSVVVAIEGGQAAWVTQ